MATAASSRSSSPNSGRRTAARSRPTSSTPSLGSLESRATRTQRRHAQLRLHRHPHWRLAQPGHQSSAPETYITAVESVRTNWLTVTKHQVTKINWSGSTLPLTATCMEFAPPAHDRVVRVRPAPAPAYAPVPAVSKAVDPNPPPDRDPFFSPRPHTYCFIHAAVDFIYSQSTFVSSILDLNCSNPNPTKLEDELHSRNRPCSRQRSSSSAVWDNTITPDMTTPEKAFALLLSDFRLSDFIN